MQKVCGVCGKRNRYPDQMCIRDRELDDAPVEIVHSLAKWKRMALKRYGFCKGEGLYTDMNAIRRDEDTDNLHSIYVDQWDWEKIIGKEERTIDTLKTVVNPVSYTHLSILIPAFESDPE